MRIKYFGFTYKMVRVSHIGPRHLIENSLLLSSDYTQQPSPLLYSIDIWTDRKSRLRQRETNHYIARCTSGRLPAQFVIDLFAQH